MPVRVKRIYGAVSRYRVPGSTEGGYRPVWDLGRVGEEKRKTRRRGPNRPST